MTHTEALDRVAKLLRLAKSDNPHEAASAAALAQKIIDRHNLDVAALNDASATPLEPVRDEMLDSKTSTWSMRLASALCDLNGCRIYYRPGQSVQMIGRASDTQTVRYLYQWLTREIDRLCARDGAGMGKTWRNNFRLGAVDAVTRRLREEKETTREEAKAEAFARDGEAGLARVGAAIVRVSDRAEVDAYASTLKLRGGSARSSTYDGGAREAGARAGGSIGLNNRGAMGAGARRMGSGS